MAELLRAIESARPPPIKRVWAKQGRRRIPPDSTGLLMSATPSSCMSRICLEDRLLIRYPDALYQLPRAQIRSIAQHARGRAEGENAMAEYEMTAQIDGGGGPFTTVAIAEVVELRGHHEADDTSDRLAVLLVLAAWLDQVWR
jgi:hypothetical protein